ncbi:MAG: zf-HC2 domain-containing protein [Thermodesulfobacteriota bacterium]
MTETTSTSCDLNEEHLLLAYVEDLLDPHQRVLVEEHLLQCGRCVAEIHGLREVIHTLKHHRDAFCPEPWEIYEFITHGRDPENRVSQHLQACPADREMARLFATQDEVMPQDLWEKIQGVTRPSETEPWWSRFVEWFRRPWGVPALGAAAVAAAVLVLVFVMPREPYQPVAALSMVSWDEAWKPKTSTGPRVTVLLSFDAITPGPGQEEIDSVYKAISPDMDLYQSYSLVRPSEVKLAQEKGQISLKTRHALLQGLHKKLAVAKAVFVTFTPAEQGSAASVEVIDCASGIVLDKRTEAGASTSEIGRRIGKSLKDLLDRTNTLPRNTAR